jgi:hypothetical protein
MIPHHVYYQLAILGLLAALDNLRRKGLLPRLTNDRATCLLCRLFRLGLRRFCFLSVAKGTAN